MVCSLLIDDGAGRSLLTSHEFLTLVMNSYHEPS